jgi:hypothetical protein
MVRTDAHAITQARCDLQPRPGFLYNPTYAQGPRQCSRGSRSRRGAPPDNVDWASATCAQEFNWYLEITLPTGGAQAVFSILRQMLSLF